jgi:hypothetical protein
MPVSRQAAQTGRPRRATESPAAVAVVVIAYIDDDGVGGVRAESPIGVGKSRLAPGPTPLKSNRRDQLPGERIGIVAIDPTSTQSTELRLFISRIGDYRPASRYE